MSSVPCPGWSGLREPSHDDHHLRFANGGSIQLHPPLAFPPPDRSELAPSGIPLAQATSLLLCKQTTVCSADDSTTHHFSLTFRAPHGDLLRLWDEDRYAGWDRDLDALDSDVRSTALYLAQALKIELRIADSPDQPPRPFHAPQLSPEQAHLANGEVEKALELCEQTLQNYPGLRPALRRKADYLNRLGRYPQAGQVFRQLLDHDPDDSDSRIGLADSLLHQGHKEQALQLLEEGIRRHPKLSLREKLAQLQGQSPPH